MLKKVLLGILAAIILFIGYAAMQPSEFTIKRQMTIAASPDAVFSHVNNLMLWQAWSPWARLDPNAKNVFSGPKEGQGAMFSWAGNADVGVGSMTIIKSTRPSVVDIKLVFKEPFESEADTTFKFVDNQGNTDVHWSMSGHNNLISKIMCIFMDMDKMVGGDFEKGLLALKKNVEP